MSKTAGITDLKHLTNIRAWVEFGATKEKPSVADQQSFAFLDQLIEQAEKIEYGAAVIKIRVWVLQIKEVDNLAPTVSVHPSKEVARAKLAKYAKDSWSKYLAGDPTLFAAEELIANYFDDNDEEWFDLEEHMLPVRAGSLTFEVTP